MDARTSSRGSHSSWKGLIAGAAGGLVASWAMEQFQQRFSHVAGDGADRDQRASGLPQAWDARSQDQVSGQSSSATERAAAAGAQAIGADPLGAGRGAAAAQSLHYAFGTGVGAVYGALAEADPRVTLLGGILFGLGVWAAADEISTAVSGLAPAPTERPPLAHAYSVLSHVVYGVTTEGIRRGGRALLQ
jgi:putative membrane protein